MILIGFKWLILIYLLSFIFFPISGYFFKNLSDRGYTLSKTVSILLFSYAIWVVGHTMRIDWFTIFITLALLVFLIYYLFGFNQVVEYIRSNLRYVLTTELIFISVFILGVLIRSLHPEINRNEMPWDSAVMNSVFRSSKFPPLDPWFGTKVINYYYFGLFIFGLLAKMINVLPTYLFNLIVPTIYAITAQSFFGLACGIFNPGGCKRLRYTVLSVLGVFLYLFVGNIYSVFTSFRLSEFEGQIPWFAAAFPGTIDIAEFPALNFFTANPHPHVISMIFFVLFISVCFAVFRVKNFDYRYLLKHKLWTFLLWIFLGTVLINNSWDTPPLYLFLLIIILIKNVGRFRRIHDIRYVLYTVLIVFTPIFLTYLPFFLTIKSPVSSISPLPKATVNPKDFFYVFGVFLLVIAAFLVLVVKREKLLREIRKNIKLNIVIAVSLLLIPYMSWVFLHILRFIKRGEDISQVIGLSIGNIIPVAPFAILFGIAGLFFFNIVSREIEDNKLTLLSVFGLLLVVSFAIPYGVELFMIREAWGIKFGTIFKFYYLLWSLLALISVYAMFYIHKNIHNFAIRIMGFVLIAVCLVFPISTLSYEIGTSDGLSSNGLGHLDGGEQEAIRWINNNILEQSIILEGMYYDIHLPRISTYTGHPTVLGTIHLHENLFRPPGIDFAQIEEDIKLIYSSSDLEVTRELIDKYKIDYIFIGNLERDLYGEGVEEKFFGLGFREVYSNNIVKIIKI